MKKVLKSNIEPGSKESNEPRILGSIVSETLHGKSPLAIGYRQYIASQENGEDEEQGWHANTELGCDLKTFLRSDKRAKVGKSYPGVLRCDSEGIVDEYLSRDPHYTFVETLPWLSKRNPCVFRGKYITVTRRDDGTLRLNFRPMPKIGEKISVEYFTFEVYRELRQALEGLIGKK